MSYSFAAPGALEEAQMSGDTAAVTETDEVGRAIDALTTLLGVTLKKLFAD